MSRSHISAPICLTVNESIAAPLGFHDPRPTFSWKLDDTRFGAGQQAYQVVANQEDTILWDSGRVCSDQSLDIPYEGRDLESRERVTWKVKYWDQDGEESPWSDPASIEMGLLSRGDWSAKWISSKATSAEVESVRYFRKAFSLEQAPTSARVYVTSRGLFDLWINGNKIGSDYLTPGWTNYHTRLDTITYDVTAFLKLGENVIGARLAAGWYMGPMFGGAFGENVDLLAQMEISTAEDDIVIATDGSWTCSTNGPETKTRIYYGEDYDATREMPGWSTSDFDADGFDAAVATDIGSDGPNLTPKPMPTVKAMVAIDAQSLDEREKGRTIFDLGQNIAGLPELSIPCKAGQTVTVRVAEMLEADGSLYTENYRGARSQMTYIPAKDGHIKHHSFGTFFGFRYVEITGYDADHAPEAGWLRGVVLHTSFEQTGAFESSHDMLNKLQSNIQWGQRGNFIEAPTDCPQRDERMGWTGDAQVFAPVSIFNFNTHAFWASWLENLRSEEGCPDWSPSQGEWKDKPSPGWSDAMYIIPWEIYRRTGDVGILKDNYKSFLYHLDCYTAISEGNVVPEGAGYGDWLQPVKYIESSEFGCKGETPFHLINTAHFGYNALLASKCATVLGRAEDAERFAELHQAIREAASAKYLDAEGRLTTDAKTQTGYLLLLAFELVVPEKEELVAQHLSESVSEFGNRLNTGFLGTPLLSRLLDDYGYSDQACAVLFTDEYPSWFFSIDQGATTMWERWNSYTKKDGFGNAGMNSFNHYAYGAIGQFMYERLAGLAPDVQVPGYKHIMVRPLLNGHPLTHASAALETRYGAARSSWVREGGTIQLTVQVPPNTTATVVLPGTGADDVDVKHGSATFSQRTSTEVEAKLVAGRYSFEIPAS